MQKLIISVLAFTIFLLLLGWYFSNIAFYLIISLVIAAALRPMTNRINSVHVFGHHIPRWMAILCSFATIGMVLFLITLLFIPLIIDQIEIIQNVDIEFLYEQIQRPINKVEGFLIKFNLVSNNPGNLFEQVKETILASVREINFQGFINGLINTTSSLLITILAVVFISFFLLLENGLLRRNIINLVPNEYFELSVATFHKVERLLSNYLVGLLIQMSAIFTIASTGLAIVGVDYALTIGVFAAVANLIPYAGPLLGATFGVIVGLITGDFIGTEEMPLFILKILSVFSVVQLTDNLFLQPLIFSKSVKAHPLEIFVIIFAGAKVGGVIGMVLAIPVYTIFRVSVQEFYKGYKEYRIFKIK
ncbi:AI-2E family transporter [Echinicola vietnamensis]|uniref:Putative permease n=1 Tax=Echinicola vietnamensis (strain DSM 17526 / LMG 23754 / KMM 6221) TaxID=926556 RepID=L0FZN7_ECHVK|nr:AI-2E family transporter [Echinicola vietnamensis]AGA78772.1 putative permease [Echinicola vietnamensis DSM 17526]